MDIIDVLLVQTPFTLTGSGPGTLVRGCVHIADAEVTSITVGNIELTDLVVSDESC